jgi:hypothetical protein
MPKYSLGIITVLVAVASCGNPLERNILGAWTAITVTEESDTLQLDPSEIHFSFTENGSYTFQSTLGYREAGSFSLNDNLLLTTDTLQDGATEKKVLIYRLEADTLILHMKQADKNRQVHLIRD